MKIPIGLALPLWVLLVAVQAAEPPSGAQAVLTCMRGNLPETLQVEQFELKSTDRAGSTRVLDGVLYAQREDGLLRSRLTLSAPLSLAGAAYLMRERADTDEMYMYLPALNRVRRITGAAADGALFGTDISYADIRQIENAFADSAASLEAPASEQGRPVSVLLLGANPHQQARYQKIRVWVDKTSCIALKTVFYGAGHAIKEMTVPADSLKQVDHRWLATRLTVRDLVTGTHTELHITGVQTSRDIPRSVFDPHTYYLGAGS